MRRLLPLLALLGILAGPSVAHADHYDAFGKRNACGTSDPVTNQRGFQGRPFDPGIGLQDSRNRMYDPETGRFAQWDRVDDPGNWGNPSNFADCEPVNRTDPLGNMLLAGDAEGAKYIQDSFAAVGLNVVTAPWPGGGTQVDIRTANTPDQIVAARGKLWWFQDTAKLIGYAMDQNRQWVVWGAGTKIVEWGKGFWQHFEEACQGENPNKDVFGYATGQRIEGALGGIGNVVAGTGEALYEVPASTWNAEAWENTQQRMVGMSELWEEIKDEGPLGRLERFAVETRENIVEAEMAGDSFAAGQVFGSATFRVYLGGRGGVRLLQGGVSLAGGALQAGSAPGGLLAFANGGTWSLGASTEIMLNAGAEAALPVAGGTGLCMMAAGKPDEYPRDYQSRNTVSRSVRFKSEGEARNFARQKVGKNPIDAGDNKLRSVNGRWQYRAKPGDVGEGHVHLERLDPRTGEVLENWHLTWPEGGSR